MIVAWRLDKASRTRDDSFSGRGAQLVGGRWNHKGSRAVYAAESLSLAALELFVHTQEEGRNIALACYKIEIPDSVAVDRPAMREFPANWREEPVPKETQDFGTAWLKAGTKAVLAIPSVIVPVERNLLLNPDHPDFAKIRVAPREDFSFDPRMWKQRG